MKALMDIVKSKEFKKLDGIAEEALRNAYNSQDLNEIEQFNKAKDIVEYLGLGGLWRGVYLAQYAVLKALQWAQVELKNKLAMYKKSDIDQATRKEELIKEIISLKDKLQTEQVKNKMLLNGVAGFTEKLRRRNMQIKDLNQKLAYFKELAMVKTDKRCPLCNKEHLYANDMYNAHSKVNNASICNRCSIIETL